MSRQRTLWLDLGAAAGVAAGWALVYPLLADGGTDKDEQLVGLLSTVLLGGGVTAAWLLTRDMGPSSPGETSAAVGWSDGELSFALPIPRFRRRLEGFDLLVPLVAGRL